MASATKPRHIVIVGGVAAGAGAAAKARRTDEAAEIIVFERGPYVSFANCGLPYYVGGDIPRRDDLLLMTPERFAAQHRIRIETHHEVTHIDRDDRRVEVIDHRTGEWSAVHYDRLVIATGGRPIVPPIPGIHLPGVFTLTTVPEAEAIRSWIEEREVRDAVWSGAARSGSSWLRPC